MSRLKTLASAAFTVVMTTAVVQAEDINYSDGQSHDFSAEETGTHVGSITLSNDSKLNITSGELDVDNSSVKVNGATLTIKSDAKMVSAPAASSSVQIYNNGTLTIDGGEMNGPATTTTGATPGAIVLGSNSLSGNSGTLKVTNGGKMIVNRSTTSQSSMMRLSKKSTVLVEKNSSMSFGAASNATYPLSIGNADGCSFTIRDSVFKFNNFRLGGGVSSKTPANNSQILFDNAVVTGSLISVYGVASSTKTSNNNAIRITGSQSQTRFSFKVGEGDSNKNNTLTLEGGQHSGDVTLTVGSGNSFIQTGGSYRCGAKAQTGTVTLGGTKNMLKILGGEFVLGTGGDADTHPTVMTFSETANGCQAVFSNCTAQLVTYGYFKPALAFTAGAKSCSVVIDENARLSLYGEHKFGSAICEDCAFEFRGTNPRLQLTYEHWTTADYQFVFGNASSDYDDKTVALRFILPKTPYATAPVYGSGNLNPVKLYPNAKIIVKEGDWTLGDKKLFYPLVYDKNDFNGELSDSALMASLNAHADLPEGAVLEYHAGDKVLGVKMPRKQLGLILSVY